MGDYIGYHATREGFAGFGPGLGATGFGVFLTSDMAEACGRFADAGDLVLEVRAALRSEGSLDDLIAAVLPGLPGGPGMGGLAARAEAAGGLSVGQAAFRMEYGRAFNDAVAAEALRRGHDHLASDGDPDWVAVLRPGLIEVLRTLDAEGRPVEA